MEKSLRKKIRSILKNRRFWFSHKLPVNTGKYLAWPISYGAHKENLTTVQSDSWFNKKFANLKSKKKFSSKDFGSEAMGWFANGVYSTPASSAPNFKEAASLVSNGFTSNVMLGKLRAIDLNLSAAKNRLNSWLSKFSSIDFNKRYTDRLCNMAAVCLSEPECSVADFSNLLKVEVLARNPALLRHEMRGEDIFKYDKNANFSPSSIADKLYLKQARISTDTFNSAVKEIGKKLGVSMYENKDMTGGTVEIYPFRRFAATRQAIRNFKNKLLRRRPETIGKGLYQLEYPSLGSNSATKDAEMVRTEQLYTILKALATKSVEDYLSTTRLMIVDCGATGKKANNLPNIFDFDNNRQYLKKASACLIASELSLMVLGKLDKDAATMMRDCFKIEAGQNLSKLHGETKSKFMPLIADYFAESINNFAKDFKLDIAEFAKAKGVELPKDKANNLGNALYCNEKIQPLELFGTIPTPEECASLNGITKDAIKQEVIDRIKQAGLEASRLGAVIYGGETIDDMVKSAAKDLDKQESHVEPEVKPEGEVSEVINELKSEPSEPIPQPELNIESPRNLYLSSLAKTLFKKVDKEGKLVPLSKTDTVRFELVNDGLGHAEEKIILNDKVVEGRLCETESDFVNPEFVSDDGENTIYIQHEWIYDENWGNKDAKLFVKKENTPISQHGYSLYKDEEHLIYKFDGSEHELFNDFAKTPEPNERYFVNGKECDKGDYEKLLDFCTIQANRKDISLAQVSEKEEKYHFKNGVLLTTNAAKQGESVLLGGVYCTPKQKELVTKFCNYEDVKPVLTPFALANIKENQLNDHGQEFDDNFTVDVTGLQSRRWFRVVNQEGKLIPVSAGLRLKFIQSYDGLHAFIKDEEKPIYEFPKHMLYLGRVVENDGVYAVKGFKIDKAHEQLHVKTGSLDSRTSLNSEHEEIDFLTTGDQFTYDKENKIIKVNGHSLRVQDYRILRSLLSVYDNYETVTSLGIEDHEWRFVADKRPVTQLALASDKKFNFNGVICSQIEHNLYLKYGVNEAIKQGLQSEVVLDSVEKVNRVKLKNAIKDLVKIEFDRSVLNKINSLENEINKNPNSLGNIVKSTKIELLEKLNSVPTIQAEDGNAFDKLHVRLHKDKNDAIDDLTNHYLKKFNKDDSRFDSLDEKRIAELLLYTSDDRNIVEMTDLSVDKLIRRAFKELDLNEIVSVDNSEENLERGSPKDNKSRQKFLASLISGEEPRPMENVRELEKVRNCINWINTTVASVVDDYVDKTLKPLQIERYNKCRKGEIDFVDYEIETLGRITQANLARRVAQMLKNPLLVEKSKNEPGIEIEKEVWNELRDWTNGIAYATIDFYDKNKAAYGDKGITRDVFDDYVQTIGTVKRLKECIAPSIEHIINDKSRNEEYAKVKGLNNRQIINPNPNEVLPEASRE